MSKRTLAPLIRNFLAAGACAATAATVSTVHAQSTGSPTATTMTPQATSGYSDDDQSLGSANSTSGISNYAQYVSAAGSDTGLFISSSHYGRGTASTGSLPHGLDAFTTGPAVSLNGGFPQTAGALPTGGSNAQPAIEFPSTGSAGSPGSTPTSSTQPPLAIGQKSSTQLSFAGIDASNKNEAFGTAPPSKSVLEITQASLEGENSLEIAEDSMPWSVLPSGNEVGTSDTIGTVRQSESDRNTGSGGSSSPASSSGSQDSGQGWSPSSGASSGVSGLGSVNGQQSSGANRALQTASLPPDTTTTEVQDTATGDSSPDAGASSGAGSTSDNTDSTSTLESSSGSQTDGIGNGTLVSSSGNTSDSNNTSSESSGGFGSDESGSTTSGGSDSESISNSDSSSSGSGGQSNSDDSSTTDGGPFTETQEPCVNIPVTEPTDPEEEIITTSTESDLVNGDDTSAPVVPEPGSLLMLVVGSVFGGAIYKRRRRKLPIDQQSKDTVG